MKINELFIWMSIFIALSGYVSAFSQVNGSSSNWDNQIYIGNKIAGGKGAWRYSGELQVRLEDNMQSLDNWYVEGVASYLYSEKIEIVPDFRYSIKPNEHEYRPGLGILYKLLVQKFQFVNQLKWQIDFDSHGNSDNGLRYAVFLNYLLKDKLMSTFAAGAFYRWQDNFQGFQFIKFGPGLAYVFDGKHILNFNYLLSATNNGDSWSWAGIPVIQLIINITADYKYIPAKYFNF